MHLHPGEPRAARVREQAGVTHLRITRAWNAALRRMEPDLALDIGANYGEIALSGRYSDDTDVVLVEANPALAHHLRQSLDHRKPSAGGRWQVLEAAASDREGEAQFIIDRHSSGASHLAYGQAVAPSDDLTSVSLVRIDRLAVARDKRRVLFKLDVEGEECAALRGMAGLLNEARSFVGIVEMREQNLQAAGFSCADLWALARSLGGVAVFDHRDRLVDCSEWDYTQLTSRSRALGLRVNQGADLVVFREFSDLAALSVPSWITPCAAVAKAVFSRP